MLDNRRKITYITNSYRGVYKVSGSSGSFPRTDPGNVKKWIEANSLGNLRDGKSLVFDGGVLCTLEETMVNRDPSNIVHGREFMYAMQLEVSISPRGKAIPEGLLEAIRADNYIQGKEE
jgi:hypothetical protein